MCIYTCMPIFLHITRYVYLYVSVDTYRNMCPTYVYVEMRSENRIKKDICTFIVKNLYICWEKKSSIQMAKKVRSLF